MMKNFVLLLLVTFLFTACGGGGLSEVELRDSSNAAPSPISGALTGTAATGAPAANAIVRVNCKTGGDNGLKKGLTDAFGKWSIAMGDCGGPYVVRVKGAAAGKSVDILSVADDEDVGGIVNVTPITHLISSNVLGNADPDTAFSQVANFTKNDIQTAQGKVRNALENVIKAVTKNADVSNVDLINTAFATDHSGLDGILDAVDIQVTGNNSVNVQVVGEAAIRVDPTDDNDLDAKAASIVADETKVDNLLASYGSVGALLDGLISYIKQNGSAISGASSNATLPNGYSTFFHSQYLDAGMEIYETLQNIQNFVQEFQSIKFTNTSLKLHSETEALILANIIADGVYRGDDVNLDTKKEDGSWKIYGNQLSFDNDVRMEFDIVAKVDSTATYTFTKKTYLVLDFEEGQDIGAIDTLKLYKCGVFQDDTSCSAAITSAAISKSDGLTSDNHTMQEITDTSVYHSNFGLYKVEFLSGGDAGVVEASEWTYIKSPVTVKKEGEAVAQDLPSFSYSLDGGATKTDLVYAVEDQSFKDYCADTSTDMKLYYNDSGEGVIKYFWTYASDNTVENEVDYDTASGMPASVSVPSSSYTEATINQKSVGMGINSGGVDVEFSFQCGLIL